jgi:hypothetical protein
MRRFIIAAALALGLMALWAAILPLAAQDIRVIDHSMNAVHH